MGTDHEWVAVEAVVRAALADADVLGDPPRTEEQVGYLAETIADHVVGAFVTQPRPK
jgi:hypothetical protein